MKQFNFLLKQWVFVFTAVFFFSAGASAETVIHQQLVVKLQPDTHQIQVTNTIQLPINGADGYTFLLHEGMEVEANGVQISRRKGPSTFPVPVEAYSFEANGIRTLTLRYSGEIYHPMKSGEEYARSFSETPGIVSEDGVFLSQTSVWYPRFENARYSFEMDVQLPAGWTAVSQGTRSGVQKSDQLSQVVWTEKAPQEEIYIIAARFSEYTKRTGAVEAMAFLRHPDPALAQKYLDVTAQYIEMYRQLIGPYPYTKFALVENFWETGYGMPSFTLLGPSVIRLPFILHSSYPHEILHNWWGNGVYVDYESGNWAEGLTSYLADQLIQQQRGKDAVFRRNILQGYADFVDEAKDFALSDFRSRHSASSEAIGYGKTQMVFHMLRQALGDDLFARGLKRLYMRFKFKKASWSDVEKIFSEVAGKDLSGYFSQWVRQVGAPSIQVSDVARVKENGKWRLRARLTQSHVGDTYILNVPVAVTLQGSSKAQQFDIAMTGKHTSLDVELDAKPLRLDLDSEFDLFRRLDRAEIPPALSQAFGANDALIVLPSGADRQLQKGYEGLIATWKRSLSSNIEVVFDNQLDSLPADKAVWLLGWKNKFRPQLLTALKEFDVQATEETARYAETDFSADQHAIVVASRNKHNAKQAVIWLASNNIEAIPGLARKLPHYRKYSYLAFEGDEPNNVAKGQWQVRNSPMSYAFDDADGQRGTLKKRKALAELPSLFSEERMMADVRALAAKEMEGRGLASKGLDLASKYIAAEFKAMGLQPGGDDGSYLQSWHEDLEGKGKQIRLQNVIAILPGVNPKFEGQSVVIAAHHDHLGFGWPDVRKGSEGKLHAGADDNASGVAVMLELARMAAKGWQPQRSIVFVAFTAEEADKLGSRYYVNNYTRYPADKAIGMVNLDTVGRLGDAPVTVFGTGSAREWVHIVRGIGFVTGITLKPVPGDFGSSDQKSFLDIGVPAIQLFGSVHNDFHRVTDTADKVEGGSLVKMAMVLSEAAQYLSDRAEPLNATLDKTATKSGVKQAAAPRQVGRKVSMGTVPDFAYGGPGVRMSDVVADSPAAKAGLKAGDLIVEMNGKQVDDLGGFSRMLRAMNAGDKASVVVMREGKREVFSVVLEAR